MLAKLECLLGPAKTHLNNLRAASPFVEGSRSPPLALPPVNKPQSQGPDPRASPRARQDSSDVLNGDFESFRLTPANEQAYYMYMAIRRSAAACRSVAAQGTLGLASRGPVERLASQVGFQGSEKQNWWSRRVKTTPPLGPALGHLGGTAQSASGRSGSGEFDRQATREALIGASSVEGLYRKGDMGWEESLAREDLSAAWAYQRTVDTWNKSGCARCEPIDSSALETRRQHFMPRPAPSPKGGRRRSRVALGAGVGAGAGAGAGGEEGVPASNSSEEEESPGARRSRPVAKGSGVEDWMMVEVLNGLGGEGERSRRYRSLLSLYMRKAKPRGRVRVGRSAVQGLGVFSEIHVEAHHLIMEYIGEMIRREVAERRESTYEKGGVGGYIHKVSDRAEWKTASEVFIDTTRKGNMARYINHSCDPNCFLRTFNVLGQDRVFLFALRGIRAREELSIAYQPPVRYEKVDVDIPSCHCGKNGCLGRIASTL
ncbi:unnamed protein product [Discosporangium mesarthrocarpum]